MLALGSAALYGATDFLGGLASRRVNTLAIVVTSQGWCAVHPRVCGETVAPGRLYLP